MIEFYGVLKSAGHRPEAHIFGAGGHGFGMRKQGTSRDLWIDEFHYWLEVQGFTKPADAIKFLIALAVTDSPFCRRVSTC
jgi:hypothetical protein